MADQMLHLAVDASSPVPKYYQIYEQVRHLVDSGQVEPGQMLPPARTLTQQLNVDYTTVHRALARLAKEGYVSRYPRQGTFVQAVQRATPVGLVCPEVMLQDDCPARLRELTSLCRRHLEQHRLPYRVYVVSPPEQATHTAHADLLDDVRKRRVRALILTDNNAPYRELTVTAEAAQVPLIAYSREARVQYRVCPDTEGFFRQACARLRRLGRRRLGVIYNIQGTIAPSRPRLWALASEAGLTIPDGALVGRPCVEAEGYRAAAQLHGLNLDSLIIFDDHMARGVDRYLTEHGIAVPDELAVATVWVTEFNITFNNPFIRFASEIDTVARHTAEVAEMILYRAALVEPDHLTQLKCLDP